MGYRKDIKRLTRELREKIRQLRDAQRFDDWEAAAYIAGEIQNIAYDIRSAAASKALRG